jgi:hypothetical protein
MSLAPLAAATGLLAALMLLATGAPATTAPHRPALILRADEVASAGLAHEVLGSALVAASPVGGEGMDAHDRSGRFDTGKGGLPGPASWILMVIGVGMIGGALRGFIVANRHLARLQPEELD